MPNTCPIPSPEQRRFDEIRETAERTMLEKVWKAVSDATAEVAHELQQAGLSFEPTHVDYFTFAVQQAAFVRLCGGDPTTLQGGDPQIGERIIRNGQQIIDHYWRGNGAPHS